LALYEAINWSGRELLWAPLVAAWMTSPLIGLGLGTSSAILRSLFYEDEGLVAHNEYLRLGTDTGLVGIALFLLAWIAWCRTAAAASAVPGRRSEAIEMALPALGVLVAWAVIAITDNAFDYYAPLTQYAGFLVGGCAVLSRTSSKPRPRTPAPRDRAEAVA
jgi:O-antigen ligase